MPVPRRVLLLLKPSPAREEVMQLLGERGFQVTAQPSTFRAVSSLARTPADAVVVGLDDLLEEELEVIKVIREECPQTMILLTFSPINRRKAQLAMSMGAEGYVLEPLRAEELAASLRRLETAPAAAPSAQAPAAEPLAPEEVDFINSSLKAAPEAPEKARAAQPPVEEPSVKEPPKAVKPPEPEPATEPDESAPVKAEEGFSLDALLASARATGRLADEKPPAAPAPPPHGAVRAVETEVTPERLASLRKLGASVAHEINNPLTTLSGWIQLLLKKTNGNQDLRRTLVNMKEEADRIADVVRELSAISEPDLAGRGPMDINTIAEAVIENFVNTNGHSRVAVKKIFMPAPPCVKVDYELFVRALSELLNSHYLDLGNSGSLVFTTAAGEDYVAFDVYEPGSQVDLEAFGKALGALDVAPGDTIGQDLALARCQEVIGSHGGTFTAECDPREGLSFQLRLPRKN